MMINGQQKIIKNGSFTWAEYATAKMWGKLLQPTEEQKANAIQLFTYLEGMIRMPWGQPLFIASGARNDAYTQYLRSQNIPAAIHSAHNEWKAVDLYIPRKCTPKEFWDFCKAHWPGRIEHWVATPSWVHLDTREWGKRITFKP